MVRVTALLAVASAIAAGAISLGVPLLDSNDAPLVSSPGVQVLGPRAGAGERGLVVRLGVRTTGCQDAPSVVLVAVGTSEYWRRVKRSGGDHERFAVIIGDLPVAVRRVRVGPPDAALSDDSVFFSPQISEPVKGHVVRRNERTTVVTGNARGWSEAGRSLILELDAPWLSRRDYSSCWLTLPALTGISSESQAAVAGGLDPGGSGRDIGVALTSRERAGVGVVTTLLGASYVQTFGSSIDTGASSPQPRSNGRTWNYSCGASRAFPNRTQILRSARRGKLPPGVLTRDGYSADTYEARASASPDCAAMAVLTDSSSAGARDLFLLLLGAALGIAGALIVEAVLTAFRLRSR
jgi:hypothetical protein